MKYSSELVTLKRDKRKALNKSDIRLAVEICNRIGVLLSDQEDFEGAADEHLEELRLSEALGDENGQAIAHRLVGECLCELGRFREALDHHNRYLELSQSVENVVETQRAWATLGRTHYKIHCSDTEGLHEMQSVALSKAETAYFKALQMAEGLKSQLPPREYAEMKARLLLNLGLTYDQKSCIAECADSIRQAFFLCKKFGLQQDLHRCQFCLATVYQHHGQLTSALRIIDEAILSARQLKNKKNLSDSLLAKAQMLLNVGDYAGAKLYAVKAHKKCTTGLKQEVERFLKVTVGICRAEEKMIMCDSAERYKLLECVADALASVGSHEQAILQYQKMLDLSKELAMTEKDLAPIYSSLAQTFDDVKNYEMAIEYYEKELECRQDSLKEQCKTLLLIADVQEKQNCEVDVIQKTYEKAFDVAVKEGSVSLQVRCLEERKSFCEVYKLELEAEDVVSKLDDFTDRCSSECEEVRGLHPFDDVSIGDLSDFTDSDDEDTTKPEKRPQRKKTVVVKKNEKGETPLHRACIKGDFKAVKRYLQNGHPVNPRDNCGWLPIHEAANYGYTEIVQFLLDNGALKDDRGGELCNGITPMHDAAVGGHLEVLEILLSRGASATAVNSSGETPLDCLVEWRRQNAFEMEPETLEQCSRLETRMKEIMENRGHQYKPKEHKHCHAKGGWISEDDEENDSTRMFSHDLEDVFMDDEEDLDDLDLEDLCNPVIGENESKKDWDDPDVARKSYQEAMCSIKKKSSNLKEDVAKPESIPALIIAEENIVDDWLIDDVCAQKPKRQRNDEGFSKRKRMRQTKLTKMPLEYEVSRKKREEENTWSDVQIMEHDSNQEQQFCETATSELPQTQLFSVKVSIKSKDILVPVSDTSLTFGWLAEEAANRYFTLVGMKPTLTLSRKDGAVFTSSDVIGSLLTNSAEIFGVVAGWEHLPLTERYKTACASLKALQVDELCESLPSIDESGILSLSNICGTQQHLLKPLFRAIHFQQTLRCLCLNGIRLTNDTVQCLATSISTLPSLSRLSLQCCGLNTTNLQMFSDTFARECLPKNLQELDLSYNVLGESCSETLAKLLSSFPVLNTIKLSFCNLTSLTFKNKHLVSVLKERTRLSLIDVSTNKLGKDGVADLLSCLYFTVSLDLSRTQIKSGLGDVIGSVLSGPLGGVLQDLRLCGCHLTNDDLKTISRSLKSCCFFHELDISCNPDVTAVGVIVFLQAIDDSHLPLTTLRMEGTFVWKIDTASVLVDRFQERLLRHVSLSADSETRELFVNEWTSIWCRSATVKKQNSSSLELSVVGN